MNTPSLLIRILGLLLAAVPLAQALERPGVEFKIFQFPPDQIPRIDGKADDWAIVPKEYIIGVDQLADTVRCDNPHIAPDLTSSCFARPATG